MVKFVALAERRGETLERGLQDVGPPNYVMLQAMETLSSPLRSGERVIRRMMDATIDRSGKIGKFRDTPALLGIPSTSTGAMSVTVSCKTIGTFKLMQLGRLLVDVFCYAPNLAVAPSASIVKMPKTAPSCSIVIIFKIGSSTQVKIVS